MNKEILEAARKVSVAEHRWLFDDADDYDAMRLGDACRNFWKVYYGC